MESAYCIVPEKSLVCSNWTACHGILAETGFGIEQEPKWHFGGILSSRVVQEVGKSVFRCILCAIRRSFT